MCSNIVEILQSRKNQCADKSSKIKLGIIKSNYRHDSMKHIAVQYTHSDGYDAGFNSFQNSSYRHAIFNNC